MEYEIKQSKWCIGEFLYDSAHPRPGSLNEVRPALYGELEDDKARVILRCLPNIVTMLLFCPDCRNALTVGKIIASDDERAYHRYECKTCSFVKDLERTEFGRQSFTPKKPEDVLGGAEAWENVEKTEAKCPNTDCNSNEAYFRQMQVRSADEPMTQYFRCVVCTRQWQEG